MPPDSADPGAGGSGCPKCGTTDAEVGPFAPANSGTSDLVDIQTSRINVVSCTGCGYSELYRDHGASADELIDTFLG